MLSPRHALPALLCAVSFAIAACGGSETVEEPDPLAGCDPAEKRDFVYVEGLGAERRVHAARANGGSDVVLGQKLDLEGAPVISDDGCIVALLAEEPDTVAVWLLAADGGERRRLYSAGQMAGGALALAPDAESLSVVLAGGKLRKVDTATGEDEPFGLAGDFEITSLSYSPDGETVGFAGQPADEVSAGSRIEPDPWVVDAVGGEPTQLADTPGAEYQLAFSPDNGKLAMAGDEGLEILNLRNGTIQPLDPTGASIGTRPSWLPDSSAVVYARADRYQSIGGGTSIPTATIVARPLSAGAPRPVLGPRPALADPQWALQGTFP